MNARPHAPGLRPAGAEGPALPCPIPRALLEPTLAPIGQARTLPAAAYTSPEVLAWEGERFFAGSWVCAGRADGLANPGDQHAVRVGGETVLLVRGDDGRLRGFYNLCRHRAHELLAAGTVTNQRAIRCPYHAWVYRLDGGLRNAPRFAELDADDPVREGLVPARVAEWGGWVMVNASGDAPELAEHLGDLDELLRPYEPERLVPVASHDYVVEANWKLVVENYHECYHCPSIHPELCTVSPPESGDNFAPTGVWVGGTMDLRPEADSMSLSGRAAADPLPGLDAALRRQVLYIGLFPNLLISAHPDYVMTHRMEPVSTGQTRIECQWLFAPEAVARPGFDPADAVDFWDVTNRQDWGACESVQRGVSSRGYRQGPLAPQEDAVHDFLRLVAGGYLAGGLVSRSAEASTPGA